MGFDSAFGDKIPNQCEKYLLTIDKYHYPSPEPTNSGIYRRPQHNKSDSYIDFQTRNQCNQLDRSFKLKKNKIEVSHGRRHNEVSHPKWHRFEREI